MSTRRRALVLGTSVLVCALAGPSSSARAEEAESAMPPPLTLSLTPTSGGGPWKLKIENTGELPVRLAADPRLLFLEVTPPAGFVDPTAKAKAARPGATTKVVEPKPVRCELPPDARPSTDEGRELVVPAKRSWSSMIDPSFYCFGARERAVLVSGAVVKAHFGWHPPAPKPATRGRTTTAPLTPPFVVAPVGSAVGKIAPAKELEAPPLTLTEDASSTPSSAPAAAAGGSSLSVSLPAAQDVSRGVDVTTTVTVTNDGDKSVILMLRPATLQFKVAGPGGSVSCGTPRAVESPIRELYSTLGVRGRGSVSLLLTSVCPSDTFDEPGVYRVTPTLDTSQASARSIGLKTWDAAATGKAPMLLRVRSPRRPTAPTKRPALD